MDIRLFGRLFVHSFELNVLYLLYYILFSVLLAICSTKPIYKRISRTIYVSSFVISIGGVLSEYWKSSGTMQHHKPFQNEAAAAIIKPTKKWNEMNSELLVMYAWVVLSASARVDVWMCAHWRIFMNIGLVYDEFSHLPTTHSIHIHKIIKINEN